MCGRFVLTTPADALAREFAALGDGLVLRPRYNIAPTTDVVVVRESEDGARRLAVLRWGLVPSWAKDPGIGARLANARSESAAEKPSFREALSRRRCIVAASGFYEWKSEGRRKMPWYFAPAGARPLAIAALWERWRSPSGEALETCCLLTKGAGTVLAPIHDRMPVLLSRDDLARWLDPAPRDPAGFADLFAAATDAELEARAVSPEMNDVRRDSPRNLDAYETDQPGLPF